MYDSLKDVTIVVAGVEKDDSGNPYAVTRVLRYDFQGTVEDLEKFIETNKNFVEGGVMFNE